MDKSMILLGFGSIFLIIGLILFNLGNDTELLIQKYMGDDSFFYLVIAKNIRDCSKFCVNVKTLNLYHHRSSAPSSRPSKKIAS